MVVFSFLSSKPLGNLYVLIFSFIVLHLTAVFSYQGTFTFTSAKVVQKKHADYRREKKEAK